MNKPKVLVLNGPNLNLLGKREPRIYGSETLQDVERRCADAAHALGLALEFRQSNAEHQLIDWLHDAREHVAGVVINPAAIRTRRSRSPMRLPRLASRSSRCTSRTSTGARRSVTIRSSRRSPMA